MALIDDLNGDFADGFGAVPIAGTATQRATSALSYLTTEVRARPNLDILSNANAESMMFEQGRAAGVRIGMNGQSIFAEGNEIILAMGGLLSPHFLMQHGIGDPTALAKSGRDVLASVPGVGRNLQNHAAVVVAAHLRRGAIQARPQRNHNDAMFRYSSGRPDCAASDMAVMFATRTSWHPLAQRIAHFSPVVMTPMSRGQVSLGTDNQPLVEYNFLGDRRDEERLVDGLFRVADLLASQEMAGLVGTTVGASKLRGAAAFNARTRGNALRTGALAAAMDFVPGFGSMVLRSLAGSGDTLANIVSDPERAGAFVRKSIQPVAHHAGTCRMGSADDPLAVVDHAGRVRGIGNLRVVDASVMPAIPRANTNLPVLMLAEKLADAILAV